MEETIRPRYLDDDEDIADLETVCHQCPSCGRLWTCGTFICHLNSIECDCPECDLETYL